MKAFRCVLIALSLLFGITSAYSLDMSLGVNIWYLHWSPNFENDFRGEDNDITANVPGAGAAYNDRFESNPVLMAGPVLNLKFSERWSLGFVMLVSQDYTIESSYNVTESISPETFTARYDFTFRRYDSDLTANYRITTWLGFFAGFKYLRWDGTGNVDINTSNTSYSSTSHTDTEVDGQAFGPALGLSISVPLIEMLYFTASASVLYMKSKEEFWQSLTENAGPPVTTSSDDTFDYRGFNSMAGLGYYFTSLRSTLIIGGRYQYLKFEDDPRDVFYGVTATVMYLF